MKLLLLHHGIDIIHSFDMDRDAKCMSHFDKNGRDVAIKIIILKVKSRTFHILCHSLIILLFFLIDD